MSVQKRRRQAINRRQWVADLRVKWDKRHAEAGYIDGYFAVAALIVSIVFIATLVVRR